VRCDVGQAVDIHQWCMAGLLRPAGYLVAVYPAFPFAMSAAVISARRCASKQAANA